MAENTIDIRRLLNSRAHGQKTSPRWLSEFNRAAPWRRVGIRDKAEFCLQLAVMLQSKVSLHRSLAVLAEQECSGKMKDVILRLSKEILRGNSFAGALSSQREVFDDVFVSTAQVGQESGRLGDVLAGLAMYLEKIVALRRKVLQALTYPCLVSAIALGAALFLLLFIVPMFAEMFRTFQVELPYSTTLILSLSGLLTDYWPYGLVIVPITLLVAGRLLGIANIRRTVMKWCVHLPFVGEVILKSMIARICRTLGTLLRARVSLVDALELARRTVPYEAMRSELAQISKHVKRGSAMADPLVDSKVFPRMVAQMIAVGEETSELDTMLMKVADYYEQELDARVERLSTVIEPAVILLLGLFVATLLIAMYLPMFDLVNIVGG